MKKIIQDQRGSWSLIGILVVTAVVLGLFAYLFLTAHNAQDKAVNQELGNVAGSTKTTVPGKAMDAAKNSACQQDLATVRQAISTYQTTEGSFPPSLDAAGIKNPTLLKCPLGGEPYQYDPNTGTVKCTHPGHESF